MQEDQPDTTGTDAPATEAPQPQEAEDAPSTDTATLILVGPSYTSAFRLPQPDGGMLVIDRNGTDVPSADVDKIMAAAQTSGVALTRKA